MNADNPRSSRSEEAHRHLVTRAAVQPSDSRSAQIDRNRRPPRAARGGMGLGGLGDRADRMAFPMNRNHPYIPMVRSIFLKLQCLKAAVPFCFRGRLTVFVLVSFVMMNSSESQAEVKSAPLVASAYSLSETDKSDLIETIWKEELPEIRSSQERLINSLKTIKLGNQIDIFTSSIKYKDITYFLSAFNFNCPAPPITPEQRQCLAKLAKVKDGKILSIVKIPDFIILANRAEYGFEGYDPNLYTRFVLEVPSQKLYYELIEKGRPNERIDINMQ